MPRSRQVGVARSSSAQARLTTGLALTCSLLCACADAPSQPSSASGSGGLAAVAGASSSSSGMGQLAGGSGGAAGSSAAAGNAGTTAQAGGTAGAGPSDPPNILFVFVDDLGYGDLGSYGSTSIATPNLDRIASEGVRFTQFYSGNGICTPSRATLLTGRLGGRQVLPGTNAVYFPDDTEGMGPEQVTIAEVLKGAGYRTSLIGKWHLGHNTPYLPTKQGFDYFWGLPYSNDMKPLPLMQNETELRVLAGAVDQKNLTSEYTREIKERMNAAHDAGEPFYIQYTNNFPHVPLAVSDAFAGTNPSCDELAADKSCGLFADVVSELDWSINELMGEIEALGIADNTYVFFTSDNGPWLTQGRNGGSQGPLRNGKNSTFEGGFRVPMIVWGPGVRRGAVETSPAIMMDWLPTLAALGGAPLPADRVIDGLDLGPLLRGEGPREPNAEPFRYLYYRGDNKTPGAYREGKWKFKAASTQEGYANVNDSEFLFDLEADPGESTDVRAANPALASQLKQAMNTWDAEIKADPLR